MENHCNIQEAIFICINTHVGHSVSYYETYDVLMHNIFIIDVLISYLGVMGLNKITSCLMIWQLLGISQSNHGLQKSYASFRGVDGMGYVNSNAIFFMSLYLHKYTKYQYGKFCCHKTWYCHYCYGPVTSYDFILVNDCYFLNVFVLLGGITHWSLLVVPYWNNGIQLLSLNIFYHMSLCFSRLINHVVWK